jgi:hypothetical protein
VIEKGSRRDSSLRQVSIVVRGLEVVGRAEDALFRRQCCWRVEEEGSRKKKEREQSDKILMKI